MLARLVFKGDRSFVCITPAGTWELQLLFKRTKQAERLLRRNVWKQTIATAWEPWLLGYDIKAGRAPLPSRLLQKFIYF